MLFRNLSSFTAASFLAICGAALAQSCPFYLGAPGDPFPVTGRPGDMYAVDVNGDGILDIVLIASSATAEQTGINVLLGNGDGTYQPPSLYPINISTTSELSFVLADVNNDGRLDAIVAVPSANAVYVLRGASNGVFRPPFVFPVGGPPYRVAAGDLNNDGFVDIVAGNGTGGGVFVLMGNGFGSFQNYTTVANGLATTYDVKLADLDNDGFLDLVVSTYNVVPGNPTRLATLRGNGNGAFTPVSAHGNFDGIRSIAIADVTGDGRLDVITSTHGPSVAVHRGVGDGSILARQLLPISGPTQYSMRVAVADMNGDGIPDIISYTRDAAVSSFGKIAVNIGAGGGDFEPGLTYGWLPAATHYAFTITDADRDGLADVVAGQIGANSVLVFRNSSGGLVSIASHPQSLAGPAGASAQFTVAALGPNLQYQWMREGVPVVEGGKYTGGTTPTLTINNLVPQDQGLYTVLVSNTCNSQTSAAFLYIPAEPACPADFNGDGQLDFFDYLDFVSAYSAGCD